jgi:predicted TIM-barrel fold metal-dependent hydrolase
MVAERVRDDILFCASDFPHEPRSECRDNFKKFIAREDVREETKRKILKETPRRMYGVMN